MLKNYFIIAWRNIRRNKIYTAINMVGLSSGIACSILIFVLVSYHSNFDNFHHNSNRIYRVVTEFHQDQIGYTQGVPSPMAKALRNDYTFADKVARIVNRNGDVISIPDKNKKFQDGIAIAEGSFFDIFNFPVVQGNAKTALENPNTAIITQKIAKKYFGNENPVGKIIRIDNKINFTITGILKDMPQNTDVGQKEIFVSDQNLKDFSKTLASDDSWGIIASSCNCFVLLKPGVTPANIEGVFSSLKKKYYNKDADALKQDWFKLQPLADIHFNTDYDGYVNKKYLWALALIGLFLIATACVNFINLSTAQALNRGKEVGVKKVLGCTPAQLFWQFIAETAFITIVAVAAAYGLAKLVLPYLNELFKTELSIHPFINYGLLIFTLVITVVVIFLSGSYPGLILSRFQPIVAIKGKLSQKNVGGFSVRRTLVVVQFAISQMLIIVTIVIASQINYSKNTDLGFKKDGIVMVDIPLQDSIGKIKMQTLRNNLMAIQGVEQTSFCLAAPASGTNNETNIKFNNRPENEQWSINTKNADAQYLSTFGLQLIAGRNFYPSDTANHEFVVNEATVKKLGLSSPQEIINKPILINGDSALVVGVVKNFFNHSFRDEIDAIAISPKYNFYFSCAVKMDMRNVKSKMAAIEKAWNDVYPQYVFTSSFLDENIAKFYELDDIMLKLIEAFAAIAILIGCLGLYGLVTFMAAGKTKEIGIRKVLGASFKDIIWIFGKEFTMLLLIAFAIAAPVAGLAMHKYLQEFKYRIHLSIGIFAIAIASAFLIAAITVAHRSIKAALANPVKSLKTE
ncbi:MAG: ABC transporter permease [Chitinophagaceae bacterium]|jgi:predicted permease|nr:ABC transporter permease [Chitinophagaceae bacterium]